MIKPRFVELGKLRYCRPPLDFPNSWLERNVWKPVVRPASKSAPVLALSHASPLLEEERDTGASALIADRQYPILSHWSRPGAALATDDDPVDPLEVDSSEIFKQRFDGEEADAGGRIAKVFNAWRWRPVFPSGSEFLRC